MNKNELLVFLLSFIGMNLIGWFFWKVSLLVLIIGSIIFTMVYFRPKNTYLRIAVTVLVAVLFYIEVFIL